MKNYLKLAILLFGISLILTNCEKDTPFANEELTNDFVEYEITEEDILKIRELNFNPFELRLISQKNSDGTNEKYYIIEEDIMISSDQVDKMISSKKTSNQESSKSKQYHSNNTVDNNQTITVRGVNQGGEALTNEQQTALSEAIQNYNDLNIGLDFVLTFGAEDNSLDINAIQITGGAGGRGDFPFNGNPGQIARIFTGTNGLNANLLRHIWTHEIGHTLGLRHTDWFSRESCGTIDPEDINPVGIPNANGANHIPGTPTGFDPTSVMISCFDNLVLGEFNNNDIIALEFLYPLPLPKISGASLTCGTTSQTYTLINGDSSATWQISSNLQTISLTGTSITVSPINSLVSGSAYVKATTTTTTIQKDFYIGKPSFPQLMTNSGVPYDVFSLPAGCEDGNTYWEFNTSNALDQVSEFQFSVSGGTPIIKTAINGSAKLTAQELGILEGQTLSVTVRPVNSCGSQGRVPVITLYRPTDCECGIGVGCVLP
ncbi:M57 family metalloprotease [Flavivirga aquimarina]|uniref:M57 family metalloprotease n=1 Tax=Flavivirga aquimarina TaxID=2027862 RepID=A0ABT8WGE3_9FLAO|nr:M57 family metalloprotease [Flavivirga aquimarina]MDO5972224.1 M57 family metalloprotease [Flavivirga aquimarina]